MGLRHVTVVGGGFAGLAAGVALAARGLKVSVLEARPHLGGRAYSFRDEASGTTVDNGQHVMMGCYDETLAFLDRIGAGGKVHRQRNLRVDMVDPQRGAGVIGCAALPAPLHMLAGVLGYRLLTRRERLRALCGGLAILTMRRRQDPRLATLTVAELLRLAGQSPNACRSFWHPVAIATLNEIPERAAAAPFAEVLARAFFRSRADSQFVLPSVGLSELYTTDARRFIERHGGGVECRAAVLDLRLGDDRVTAVRLRDGREIPTDACVGAVPPPALDGFLPTPARTSGPLAEVACFEASPIVSVHLWYDRAVLRAPFVGLVGTTTHWLFNRSALTGDRGRDGGQCVSAVISADRTVASWEPSCIETVVGSDVRATLPAARAARLERAVVVKERRATIATTPAAGRRRPSTATPIDNLFLAGDWIDTGLPPTIESAVLSGHRAAAAVLQRLES